MHTYIGEVGHSAPLGVPIHIALTHNMEEAYTSASIGQDVNSFDPRRPVHGGDERYKLGSQQA